jgi:hypothetical protein
MYDCSEIAGSPHMLISNSYYYSNFLLCFSDKKYITGIIRYGKNNYRIYTIILGIAAVLETPSSPTTGEFPETVSPG